MKCQTPLCNKEAIKEVHVSLFVNQNQIFYNQKNQIYYLCEKHFKIMEKYWKKICQGREIFDLTPKVDDRVKVEFT